MANQGSEGRPHGMPQWASLIVREYHPAPMALQGQRRKADQQPALQHSTSHSTALPPQQETCCSCTCEHHSGKRRSTVDAAVAAQAVAAQAMRPLAAEAARATSKAGEHPGGRSPRQQRKQHPVGPLQPRQRMVWRPVRQLDTPSAVASTATVTAPPQSVTADCSAVAPASKAPAEEQPEAPNAEVSLAEEPAAPNAGSHWQRLTDAEVADAEVAPDAEAPPDASSLWQRLTDGEGVWAHIFGHLSVPAQRNFRLVCRRWQQVAGTNMAALRPAKPKLHLLAGLMPGLTSLDLSGCRNVRNRNLAVLPSSGLRLQRLLVGHPNCLCGVRPNITNEGVASIGRLTALTELRIACCNKLTGNGTLHLAPLSQLRALALESCVRVGDAALLRLLPHLPRLAELSVLGCCKVTNDFLAGLFLAGSGGAGARLTALHLGRTRVSDVAPLRWATSLSALTLCGEPLDATLLPGIATLRQLQYLSLSGCPAAHVAALPTLMGSLPCLTRLDLNDVAIGDQTLSAVLQAANRVRHLELRGTGVLAGPLRQLTALRSLALRSSAVTQPLGHMDLLVVLWGLTHLQVLGLGLHRDLLRALPRFPRPLTLDIGLPQGTSGAGQQVSLHCQATAADIQAMAPCSAIRCLDLSFVPVSSEKVELLLRSLCTMEVLCLRGCEEVSNAALTSLSEGFPGVHIHRGILQHRI